MIQMLPVEFLRDVSEHVPLSRKETPQRFRARADSSAVRPHRVLREEIHKEDLRRVKLFKEEEAGQQHVVLKTDLGNSGGDDNHDGNRTGHHPQPLSARTGATTLRNDRAATWSAVSFGEIAGQQQQRHAATPLAAAAGAERAHHNREREERVAHHAVNHDADRSEWSGNMDDLVQRARKTLASSIVLLD